MKQNNLPIYFSIAIVIGLVLAVVFKRGANFSFIATSVSEQKLRRLMNFIDRDYVDDVRSSELLDGVIKSVVSKLDPHSVYIPKYKIQSVQESMEGKFVGIGVSFRLVNDTLTIIRPTTNGPSEIAGLKPGDRILLAGKDTLFNNQITTKDIYKSLKGDLGSKVDLQIFRKSKDSLFNVTVTRGNVNIKSVDHFSMVNDTIGYIKLNKFAKNSYKEFKFALNRLLQNGMKSLIFDLRGNSGGYIHVANQICDEFLSDANLIVFTKGKNKQRIDYRATDKGEFMQGNLYVLIDEKSASASEIVAGAIQDNDRGIIVGRRSFGKGLVQEDRALGDGSVLRLTTARYYTPSGRSIQKKYVLDSKKDNYNLEVYKRQSELFHKDSIKLIDSLSFLTTKGRKVFGGGGIVPDIFVPLDTTKFIQPYLFKPLSDFTFDFTDRNRTKYDTLSFSEFSEKFDKNSVLKSFISYLKSKVDISFGKDTKSDLSYYLYLLITRELYGDDMWYRLKLKNDKMILKVLESN